MALAVSNRLVVSVASVTSSSNAPQGGTDADAVAGGKLPPIINAAAARRSFPDRWAEYLRETYKTAYGVRKAFPGIDSKTARDWISGKRDPSGSFVAAVVASDPKAMEILGRSA